jgi:NAD(P)-dependent dehydrogenase (short-subunit alcohol dehydrogenase family)
MKDKSIRGKIVILSGVPGGIGNALMSALDESGAVAIFSARHNLSGIGPKSGLFIETDLRSPLNWKGLVETVMKRYGRIEVLMGERLIKLLPASFALLDLIGGGRMRIYRRRLFPEGIKTGK